ncbi:recombinase zinc beta ribbon domain-containing protein [Bacillus inaquosorum]|uniref:recombinase zinc beta ribbon domain-containing protein n=1 Tax=Bacillus inaquosorum TaxID=483913 RepID=UPI002281318D|nr:recombinase zinc beta ribbon domain-containing protein [Bacillus inaquosorum]MCY8169726.1 recombinase zinc beta ribbon domain-containing protein [Bacillus inaquosorum]MCY8358367.1 recombinase zinc beta ribbon domain-containing protein [Bacillus inaquosorum]MCY8421830.1 recombinase zinc beta ribbon domain-containing protein [Bacillus inaquosorum]MEC0979968.1 recombinase zinc beta ribbon domain-containing protein [Bacillus inaquosorum]
MTAAKSRGKNGKQYRLYQCGQYKNKGRTACQAHTINADKAEQYVIDELKRVVTLPYFIDKLVDKMNDDRLNAESPLLDDKKRLLKNKRKIEKQLDNLVTLLMDDTDLRDTYSKKMLEQKKQLATINDHIEKVEKELQHISKDPIDAEALNHLLKNIDTLLDKADATEKKELLALFIKDIQITKEKVSHKEGWQIKCINLMFDFTIEALQGSSSILINKMSEINCIAPLDTTFMEEPFSREENFREALSSLNILPLFMVRFPTVNPKSPINLLHQNQPHQLMRKRHF